MPHKRSISSTESSGTSSRQSWPQNLVMFDFTGLAGTTWRTLSPLHAVLWPHLANWQMQQQLHAFHCVALYLHSNKFLWVNSNYSKQKISAVSKVQAFKQLKQPGREEFPLFDFLSYNSLSIIKWWLDVGNKHCEANEHGAVIDVGGCSWCIGRETKLCCRLLR